jgi:glycosyltransferase involved in cell wall biosynthesis
VIWKNLKKIIMDNNINVVHTYTYYNSVFSLFAAKISGVRIRIVHSHNTMSEPKPSIIKKIYFMISKIGIDIFANRFVACGRDAGRALFMPWREFEVVNNGIDIDNFLYSKNYRNSIRKELKINHEEIVIMHAGRFAEVKNHEFLIDVFAEYQKINHNSRLILVGDGPLKSKIENKVEDLKLSESVMFLGLRSDVNRIYSASDLFLFPSLFEGLPVVLVEAQANGIKCLISDNIDKSTRLTDCIDFYSLSLNSEQWAKKICELDLARKDTGKIMKKSNYDMKKNIKNIENIYEMTFGK